MTEIKLSFSDSIQEMDSNEGWNYHYLGMARHVSKKSKDPGTKVGCVIVDNEHRTISTGYNGLPQGIGDDLSILNDRERKLKQIIHAEENAIIFARQSLYGHTIYVWPMLSCSSCASKVIQAGIKRVITVSDSNPRWQESFAISRKTFIKAGVEVIEYNLDSFNNLEEEYSCL